MYTVLLWESHPNLGENTCLTSDNFGSLEKAMEVFANPFQHTAYWSKFYLVVSHVQIVGNGLNTVRKNPHYVELTPKIRR